MSSTPSGYYGSSRSPIAVVFGLLKGMILGWLAFNIIVILIGGYLVVRLWNIDTWPLRADIASRLTYGKFINPQDLIPENMVFSDIKLIDVDGDGEQERVLFYRYERARGRSPVGVTVLDLNACRPRGIDSHELIPIDSDHLSEYWYKVETAEIPGVGGPHNVLIWGISADGIPTELSIFHWYDMADGCAPPAPGTRGYLNLGTFRGNGGIEIRGNRILVKERAFERSRLETVRIFEPREGSYRQSQQGPMLPEAASVVDFATEQQDSAEKSYYPEKAVVSFYLNVGVNPEIARGLLDPAAASHMEGSYGVDVAEPGQLSSMAEVKSISYTPDIERERRHEQVAIEVQVVNRRPDGTITGPHHYRVVVVGHPRAGALPYDCEWRILKFEHAP